MLNVRCNGAENESRERPACRSTGICKWWFWVHRGPETTGTAHRPFPTGPPVGRRFLLLPEGEAVGTLVLGGVALVGAHHDPVQGAVVGGLGVVGALLDGTLDALVGVHNELPP